MAIHGSLEQRLAKHPIVLPGNPFWEVCKRFGRDEAAALAVNVATTGALELILGSAWGTANVSPRAKTGALIIGGPITEKAGLFIGHFHDAWKRYRSTPTAQRESLGTYVKDALRGGSTSLIEDLVIHDPIYVGMLYAGMQVHPSTPVWMLSLVSFLGSVAAVAATEVAFHELRYVKRKHHLRHTGFKFEPYLESRFLIRREATPERVLEALSKEFHLPELRSGEYHDRYYRSTLPQYSGRIAQVRLRERVADEGETHRSAQIVYSRAAEIANRAPEQFRYFLRRKDKWYHTLEEMPDTLAQIGDPRIREELCRSAEANGHYDVRFRRTVARDPATILVATDTIQNGAERPSYLVEIKAHCGKEQQLKRAMEFVMEEFPVMQTTQGKADLTGM